MTRAGAPPAEAQALLRTAGLTKVFQTDGGPVHAVRVGAGLPSPPPVDAILAAAGVAIIAAALAALIPARRAARIPVAATLGP